MAKIFWAFLILLGAAATFFSMAWIFDIGFFPDSVRAFMIATQVITGVLLLLFLGSLFPKTRLAPWFTAWALAHLLYAVAFHFRHPQFGAGVILPAAITLPVVLLIAWTKFSQRWVSLLWAVPFVAVVVLTAEDYCKTPSLVTGFWIYVESLIAVVLVFALVQRVFENDRLQAGEIVKTNHLPKLFACMAVGLCGMAAFWESRGMVLLGGAVVGGSMYMLWRFWPRRRVTVRRLPEGFVCGKFRFDGDLAEIREASVRLVATIPADPEDGISGERWERELRLCPLLADGVAFAFDEPELTFEPEYWELTLTLTRQNGKPEKYDFQVEPVKEKAQ